MLNLEVTGWGQLRKFDGEYFELYDVASYNDNLDLEAYRKRMRKEAKRDGHTKVRVIRDSNWDYATYVYPVREDLGNKDETT